ncbi:CCA tRNA nucleotidyltransferase [Candidatus Laterigemmans baculatus]|uniref:CCA tRNA nucleotidyltransferase n=1 Tax=Candidatus Laterigemmans baculatus TaxID=2770505 RepID=UPI0013DB604A|nr:CCA tRNA nucleotidyltransferase [Candidatus Laterigemmans baculatus]
MNDIVQSIELAIATDPNAVLALEIIQRLRSEGHLAYLAGGCVRDGLLGLTPKDYDVATDAHPERIRSIFGHRRTLPIGAAFGVINVLGKKRAGQAPVEVATFRSDGPYTDGRRPDTVCYSTPAEDAQRRDFTINGLFYDPTEHQVIDFIGGRQDLEGRRIRAIGDPHARFQEDRLRLLRAVRFAASYGLEIEPVTWDAVLVHAAEVTVCSGERIAAEMRRLLRDPAAGEGLALLYDSRLSAAIMPRVDAALADAATLRELQLRLANFEGTSFGARLAALALCCDSSATEALEEIVTGWKLSTAEAEAARAALRDHAELLGADQLPWSRLQPLLVQRHAPAVVALATAIARADRHDDAPLALVRERMAWPPEQLNPPPLLSGEDLKRIGMRPGPEFRVILQRVRDAQLDGELTTGEQAEQWLKGQRD